MGFLTRLFSIGGKTRKKNGNNEKYDKSKKNATVSSNNLTRPPPILQDQEAVVNRLLRSSSTHFSVLSETEYHSLPPIPHPINNVLRAPSIMSRATQTDTYTVTVHRRMLHSRTEFPNANRSGDFSPPNSPNRRHSSPQLTPGDRSRLSKLRQDASVLSLLDIYDDSGRPDPGAFSNTPVRREHHDASLRVLLGNPSPPSLSTSKTSAEESDISWADRYIRSACHDSTSSSPSTSSLGIPVDLFKSSISPERLCFDQLDTTASSRDMDIGIDSLLVERGTLEDSSIFHPSISRLTSPTRRASQFFKFLSDDQDSIYHSAPSSSNQLPSPHGSYSMETVISSTVEDDITRNATNIPVLHVRDGPKEIHAKVSLAPRRRLSSLPLPPTQPHSQMINKTSPKKPVPLGHRTPFDELRNGEGSDSHAIPRNDSSRSVSVASSVYLHIERPEIVTDSDPYTPIPQQRTTEKGRGRHGMGGENVPPNAPARPTRGQGRKYNSRDCQCPRPTRPKEKPQNISLSKLTSNDSSTSTSESTQLRRNDNVSVRATPPSTPLRNPALTQLQTPSRPSPASSSELSPEGRQIMANIRAKAHKTSQSKTMTPRARQSGVVVKSNRNF